MQPAHRTASHDTGPHSRAASHSATAAADVEQATRNDPDRPNDQRPTSANTGPRPGTHPTLALVSNARGDTPGGTRHHHGADQTSIG
jgi:hypothetical protein